MALVVKIQEDVKKRKNIHNVTECSYFIIQDKFGKKYLQLDTYGSADREFTGKVSQSMQFSPEAIEQLKKIITREF